MKETEEDAQSDENAFAKVPMDVAVANRCCSFKSHGEFRRKKVSESLKSQRSQKRPRKGLLGPQDLVVSRLQTCQMQCKTSTKKLIQRYNMKLDFEDV